MLDLTDMEPRIDRAVQLMEMLAQRSRLKILCLLVEGPKSVQTLAEAANLSQPAMSHHLKKLRDAGLVGTSRAGQSILYSLRGQEVEAVLGTLHALYCEPATG